VILLALALLFAAHLLVDFFAGSINPLWPAMEQHLSLATGGALWIYVAWSLATSFSQFVFGLWADRGYAHWMLWLSPALVAVSLSCLGLAESMAGMTVFVVLGGLGVAAFHPEAAARAGALLPSHRSRVMAIFSLGGFLGQAAGPYYAGKVTDGPGLIGLLSAVPWGSALLAVLITAWYASPARLVAPYRRIPRRKEGAGVRATLVMWLLAIGSLRVFPAMGVLLALAYVLKSREAANSTIGAVQSAYMAGIGGGGMMCAMFVSQRWERAALWLTPLAAAPLLACLAVADGWQLVAAVGLAGFLHGIGMPVFVSYGQQLLPAGERIANSITMGVSWGVANGLAALSVAGLKEAAEPSNIFVLFAGVSAIAGLLCLGLPRLDRSADERRTGKVERL
jgi:FSR family fosmidomycin resistance protein-like MFS transporter